ncbi:site-specific DNA-methyltransferase [Sinorhizobium meliloti]|nr:site-specific DNA-methyltransferase [Sinorhizobium meliloti]MDW9732632.1 site-specific DNA-methyltransferase [Sinorhizobium meliloti]
MTVQILNGDCRDILKTLPDASVHSVVTSPPYFGLRDYGHDGQIGLEPTPADFVSEMVSVFREVRRVLRDDGTLWLNLGDSYAGSWGAQGRSGQMSDRSVISAQQVAAAAKKTSRTGSIPEGSGLKPKDLIGIPWRVAFALQDDGWYLRQDIIWHKPNPMPESVTDRCTKSHEYLFLLTKSQRYYFDADAISEQVADTSLARWAQSGLAGQKGSDRVPGKTNGPMKAVGGVARPQAQRAVELARQHGLTEAHIEAIRAVGITDAGKAKVTQSGTGRNDPAVQALADEAKAVLGGYYREFLIADKRNKRSVWTVPTMPFKGAHFATFPPELIEPCIKAGCPAGGTVLDPFGGAGTTGLVTDRLQRDAILIELNPEYAAMAERRIFNDAPLFAGDAA